MLKFELGGGCPLGSAAWLLLLVILLIIYILWDVNYFIRIIYTVGTARVFGKKKKITETTKIFGKFYFTFYKYSAFSKHYMCSIFDKVYLIIKDNYFFKLMTHNY